MLPDRLRTGAYRLEIISAMPQRYNSTMLIMDNCLHRDGLATQDCFSSPTSSFYPSVASDNMHVQTDSLLVTALTLIQFDENIKIKTLWLSSVFEEGLKFVQPDYYNLTVVVPCMNGYYHDNIQLPH